LTYGTDGTAYVANSTEYAVRVSTRAPGAVDWVVELVDWGAQGPHLKLDPGGIPVITYDRYRSSNLDHPYRKSLHFARPIP
jgi:hypothetical protein